MTTKEVMATLGVTETTAINLNELSGKGGPIRGWRETIGPSGRPMLEYNVDDVLDYKEGRLKRQAAAAKAAAPSKALVASLLPLALQQQQRNIQQFQEQPIQPQQAPSPHDWLTLAEAAAATHGLPESFLLGLIHAGELPCCDVGVRPGGRYRVKRRDLEAIDGTRAERAQTAGA